MKNKKGFTLVEAIVAFAVMALFSMCVASVFSPVLNTYRRVRQVSEAQMVAGTVLDVVRDEVRNGSGAALQVEEGEVAQRLRFGNRVITFDENGYLFVGNAVPEELASYFPDKYYGEFTLVWRLEKDEERGGVFIDLDVYVGENNIYSTKCVVTTL